MIRQSRRLGCRRISGLVFHHTSQAIGSRDSAEAGATSLSRCCGQPCLQPVDYLKIQTLEHRQPLLRLTSSTSKPFDWLRFVDEELIDKKPHAIHVSSHSKGLQSRDEGLPCQNYRTRMASR